MAQPNRIWIELDRLGAHEDNHEQAKLANAMIKRLGGTTEFRYNESKEMYEVVLDVAGSYKECSDNGHWFNLDYFGREGE